MTPSGVVLILVSNPQILKGFYKSFLGKVKETARGKPRAVLLLFYIQADLRLFFPAISTVLAYANGLISDYVFCGRCGSGRAFVLLASSYMHKRTRDKRKHPQE